jgi:hypothetical protein
MEEIVSHEQVGKLVRPGHCRALHIPAAKVIAMDKGHDRDQADKQQ